MKISQSKVRVEPFINMTEADDTPQKTVMPKISLQRPIQDRPASLPKATPPLRKTLTTAPPSARPMYEQRAGGTENVTSLQRIRAIAQQELVLIRRMRAEAVKYQQETAIKARSEAHQLVLHARLATQREIEDMIRQANEEIQKVLADIRVIRITAQEELAAQRKFTDAAKLNSMSLSMKEIFQKSTEKKPKKKLEAVKS